MRITPIVENNVAAVVTPVRQRLARNVGRVVTEYVSQTKATLRADTTQGLGRRMANTWRSEVYPVSAPTRTLNPAGLIKSNASEIVGAFDPGSIIAPNGGRYLAIPTANVPKRRGGSPITPGELQFQFGQRLRLVKGSGDTLLLVLSAVAAKNKKGWRRATARRLAQGRNVQDVVMFILVRQVRLKKTLDWRRILARAEVEFPRAIAQAVRSAVNATQGASL